MDTPTVQNRKDLSLYVKIIEAKNVAPPEKNKQSETSCVIRLTRSLDARTPIISGNTPFWGEEFLFDAFDTPLETFELTLWNEAVHEAIGKLTFPKSFLLQSEQDEEQWHALNYLPNEPPVSGELRVEFTYKVGKSLSYPDQDEHIFEVKIGGARNLASRDLSRLADPFVAIHSLPDLAAASTQMTRVIKNTLNPVFNERFVVTINEIQTDSEIHMSVWDRDQRSNEDHFLGHFSIPLFNLNAGTTSDKWYALLPKPVSVDMSTFVGMKKSDSNSSMRFMGSKRFAPTSISSIGTRAKAFAQALQTRTRDVDKDKNKKNHKLIEHKFSNATYCVSCSGIIWAHTTHIQCDDCKISAHSKCAPYVGKVCGSFPTIKLKFRYSERPILPPEDYSDLINLLSQKNYAIPVLFGKYSSEKEDTAKTLVKLFGAGSHGEEMGFILKVIDHEIESTNDSNTIFRANSLASKVVDVYMRMVGLSYLQGILRPVITDVIQSRRSCEMDPTRVEKSSEIKKNAKTLEIYLQAVLHGIFQARPFFPRSFRIIFSHIKKRVLECFPSEGSVSHIAVAGFIFLRFFCPAILGPKLFKLTEDNLDQPIARNLTLIAKCLQNLANLCEFGQKEAFMVDLNPFLNKHMDAMRAYVEDVSTLPSDLSEDDEIHEDFDETIDYAKECCRIYYHIQNGKSRVEKSLLENETTEFKKLAEVLDVLQRKVENLNPQRPSSPKAKRAMRTTTYVYAKPILGKLRSKTQQATTPNILSPTDSDSREGSSVSLNSSKENVSSSSPNIFVIDGAAPGIPNLDEYVRSGSFSVARGTPPIESKLSPLVSNSNGSRSTSPSISKNFPFLPSTDGPPRGGSFSVPKNAPSIPNIDIVRSASFSTSKSSPHDSKLVSSIESKSQVGSFSVPEVSLQNATQSNSEVDDEDKHRTASFSINSEKPISLKSEQASRNGTFSIPSLPGDDNINPFAENLTRSRSFSGSATNAIVQEARSHGGSQRTISSRGISFSVSNAEAQPPNKDQKTEQQNIQHIENGKPMSNSTDVASGSPRLSNVSSTTTRISDMFRDLDSLTERMKIMSQYEVQEIQNGDYSASEEEGSASEPINGADDRKVANLEKVMQELMPMSNYSPPTHSVYLDYSSRTFSGVTQKTVASLSRKGSYGRGNSEFSSSPRSFDHRTSNIISSATASPRRSLVNEANATMTAASSLSQEGVLERATASHPASFLDENGHLESSHRKETDILAQSETDIYGQFSKGMVKSAVSVFNAVASELTPAMPPKPTCVVCGEQAGPSGVTKSGKHWCALHFRCSVCNMYLTGETGRFERGRVVCRDHMERLCSSCRLPVIGFGINAFDQTWHPHHFKCTTCDIILDQSYYGFEEKPYCQTHFFQRSGRICFTCGKPIDTEFVELNNHKFHVPCFKCKICQKQLAGHEYVSIDNDAYCPHHGVVVRCAACNHEILGTAVLGAGRHYHPEHFKCASCQRPLVGVEYFDRGRKPYCRACAQS